MGEIGSFVLSLSSVVVKLDCFATTKETLLCALHIGLAETDYGAVECECDNNKCGLHTSELTFCVSDPAIFSA